MAPLPKPYLSAIPAYVPGKSKGGAGKRIHKLSSNETPLGPSPKAIEAYREAATVLHRYPDGSCDGLRSALADVHGLLKEQILCGAGSDELLELIAKAYLGPGDEGIYSQYGFLVYPIAILANGATPIRVEERDFTADPDAVLRHVTDRTKVVFLANPNNPTGTYLKADALTALHRALPKSCLLVLDGAYSEYVTTPDYITGRTLVDEADNVIMVRTFSKIYGLAGLRLGWAYGPPSVIETLNRCRSPFNVSTPAQMAGIAALYDQDHLTKAIAYNTTWRAWTADALKTLGLPTTQSAGNFLLTHIPAHGGFSAQDLCGFLEQEGILVRDVRAYGLPDALRISIGEEEALLALIAALKRALPQGRV